MGGRRRCRARGAGGTGGGARRGSRSARGGGGGADGRRPRCAARSPRGGAGDRDAAGIDGAFGRRASRRARGGARPSGGVVACGARSGRRRRRRSGARGGPRTRRSGRPVAARCRPARGARSGARRARGPSAGRTRVRRAGRAARARAARRGGGRRAGGGGVARPPRLGRRRRGRGARARARRACSDGGPRVRGRAGGARPARPRPAGGLARGAARGARGRSDRGRRRLGPRPRRAVVRRRDRRSGAARARGTAARARGRRRCAHASRRRGRARRERMLSGGERLDEALRAAAAAAARFEEPLVTRTGALADELRAVAARESELRRALAEADARAVAAERRAGGRASAGDGAEACDTVSQAHGADALRAEAEEVEARAVEAATVADFAQERAQAAARALAEADPSRRGRASGLFLGRLLPPAERVEAALGVDVARFEGPLRARVEGGAARTTELGAELRRLGAEEVELRRTAGEAAERLSAVDVELARTDAERDEARRRLAAAGAEPAEEGTRDELAERLDRYERRREQLGQVNPFAKEEYAAEKERLEELSTQRADLEAALAEVEQLRNDLTETVEQRFEETFEAVQRHFADVAQTLFPGGEGRLRLTESEGDDDEAEPGIEVELRPAGKRVTRLSLLSGGEKALGAIAFLFSLFLARPSPFYLLDEVEAALDDTNIGRFTELLRGYADRAQFIVITHQKRTMEAADVLYGVTMGADGVSQIVSRRLPRDEAAATA